MGITADDIPYVFTNDRRQLLGFDVEMAQRLAADLGVTPQFVRFERDAMAEHVRARAVDIVMTGARLTPLRAEAVIVSASYLDETLAFVTLDHDRQRFTTWATIRERGRIRLGVQNLPYYISAIEALLPDADVSVIQEVTERIDPASGFDAYVLPAERGSIVTMFNPRFAVVVPEGVPIRMPLVYPLAGDDAAWTRFVDAWIALKKRDGFIDALYEHWIRGRAVSHPRPRWSVVRDVLGWVE